MIFCGQCGQQLAPGMTRCPRCGAAIEETEAAAAGELHSDDATMASPSFLVRQPPTPPARPNTPQPLVLRPGADGIDYGTQFSNPSEATRRMEAPNYGSASGNQNIGTQYPPGYAPPGSGNYATQSTNYPTGYNTQGAGGYPGGMGPQMGYPQSGQYPQEPEAASGNNKLRAAATFIILLGLLLILAAVILFALHSTGKIASTPGVTPTISVNATTAPTTAATDGFVQAQTVVQHYYDDINQHDYQAAYNLWQHNPQNYTAFSQGFTNTRQSRISIERKVLQDDGTVKLTVTVNATEKAAGGDIHSRYGGYYVVGKQDNAAWKIINGLLSKL